MRDLIRAVADLMSDDGDNKEYDRACVEIVATMLGVSTDSRQEVEALLRAAKR